MEFDVLLFIINVIPTLTIPPIELIILHILPLPFTLVTVIPIKIVVLILVIDSTNRSKYGGVNEGGIPPNH